MTQQHQRHPMTRHGPSSSLGEHPLEFVCLRSNYPGSCAPKKDLHELILYHLPCLYSPSYVISLKGLWRATHFSVYTADPNKRKPPDEMLLCVCFCLVLEDHIASEVSVALGNNICLVSVGQVPSEQNCHLTRHAGFESMSAQCGELHHSNESLKELMVMAFFSACWLDLLMVGLLTTEPLRFGCVFMSYCSNCSVSFSSNF